MSFASNSLAGSQEIPVCKDLEKKERRAKEKLLKQKEKKDLICFVFCFLQSVQISFRGDITLFVNLVRHFRMAFIWKDAL